MSAAGGFWGFWGLLGALNCDRKFAAALERAFIFTLLLDERTHRGFDGEHNPLSRLEQVEGSARTRSVARKPRRARSTV